MVEVHEARRGDSARAAIELIEKAMEGVTPGPWSCRVDDGQGGVAYAATILGPNIEDRGHPVVADIPPRTMHGTHAANAAYIAACNPVAMSAILAEARKAEALKRMLSDIINAKALFGIRDLVAGWNGEHLPEDKRYGRHPDALGSRIETNCGAIYELDEALSRARTLLNGGSDAQG